MGSRVNSCDNLCEFAKEIPEHDTFDHLKTVIDNQEALISFHYKDTSSQVGLFLVRDGFFVSLCIE